MAEYVTCPVKGDTIGNSTYLRWVQFCERSCPCNNNQDMCRHKKTEISFPLNSKEVLTENVEAVKAAWEKYDSF